MDSSHHFRSICVFFLTGLRSILLMCQTVFTLFANRLAGLFNNSAQKKHFLSGSKGKQTNIPKKNLAFTKTSESSNPVVCFFLSHSNPVVWKGRERDSTPTEPNLRTNPPEPEPRDTPLSRESRSDQADPYPWPRRSHEPRSREPRIAPLPPSG
jgi:hypothetical protein